MSAVFTALADQGRGQGRGGGGSWYEREGSMVMWLHWEEVSKEQWNALGSSVVQLRVLIPVLSIQERRDRDLAAVRRRKICHISLWYQWRTTRLPTTTAWRELTGWITGTRGKKDTQGMETQSAPMVRLRKTDENHLGKTSYLGVYTPHYY